MYVECCARVWLLLIVVLLVWRRVRQGLICYCDFALYYARLPVAHALYLLEHFVGFLVCAEIAYAANPARRVEMDVYRKVGTSHLYGVAYVFGFLAVGS